MARDVEMYDENILLDYPPDHVTIGDTEYRINSDFRVSILFELLISDPEVPDDRKLLQALRLYYGDDIPPDIPEAIRMIKWFYGGGKKLKDEENILIINGDRTPDEVEADIREKLMPYFR